MWCDVLKRKKHCLRVQQNRENTSPTPFLLYDLNMSNGVPSIIVPHLAFTPAISIDQPPLEDSPTSPTLSTSPSHHQPSSPGLQTFLSPPVVFVPPSPTAGRISLDVPPSPTPTYSSNDGTTLNVPPSPTLSHKSSVVHFATSLNLRANDPHKQLSPGHLSPTESIPGLNIHHGGMSSSSSAEGHSNYDDTDTESHQYIGMKSLRHAKSDSSEITRVTRSRSHSRDKSRSKDSNTTAVEHKGKGKHPHDESSRMELPQDADTDPTPFLFKPYELAHMLDPKNFDALYALGGVDHLLAGLGTDKTHGLITAPLVRSTTDLGTSGKGQHSLGAGVGASQRHNRQEGGANGGNTGALAVPGIVVTSPDGDGNGGEHDGQQSEGTEEEEDYPAFYASFDERRRVYGRNILPQRASKSLLSLMWAALKDKVLVRPSKISSEVAFLLFYNGYIGSTVFCCRSGPCSRPFPGFWTRSPCRSTQSGLGGRNCHHGCSIYCRTSFIPSLKHKEITPILQVVVGSLNDWQKERQFQVLNEKKEERGVKVIRDGMERVVDIKVLFSFFCLQRPLF